MPELPEIESIKRGLKNYILNQKILDLEIKLTKIVSGIGTKRLENKNKKEEFINSVKGKKIVDISRRSKNLIILLDDESKILIHLKMTGQLVYRDKKNPKEQVSGGHPIQLSTQKIPNKHTYLIFTLEKGCLYYNDVRQFGYVLYFDSKNTYKINKHLQNLGPEPLENEFNLKYLKNRLNQKNVNLKKFLLDNQNVAGIGNIYADEICFDAGILPMKIVKDLKNKEIEKLLDSTKKILKLAINEGGSSVANYLLADGTKGNFVRYHKVYNRKNLPCLVCKNQLKSTKITGRTTVYCTFCQK